MESNKVACRSGPEYVVLFTSYQQFTRDHYVNERFRDELWRIAKSNLEFCIPWNLPEGIDGSSFIYFDEQGHFFLAGSVKHDWKCKVMLKRLAERAKKRPRIVLHRGELDSVESTEKQA